MFQQILPLVMLFKIKNVFTEAVSLGEMVRRVCVLMCWLLLDTLGNILW